VTLGLKGKELEFSLTFANALSSIGKLKVFPVNDPEPDRHSSIWRGQALTDPHIINVMAGIIGIAFSVFGRR